MWVPFEGMPSNVSTEVEPGDKKTNSGLNDKHRGVSTGVRSTQALIPALDQDEVSKSKLRNEAKKRRKHRKRARQAREAGEEPVPEDAEWEDRDDGQDSDTSGAKRSGSPGEEGQYKGPVLHSCQLDHAIPELLRGKTVVVIGSGASAVEAVETALERGAKKTVMIARKDKVSDIQETYRVWNQLVTVLI